MGTSRKKGQKKIRRVIWAKGSGGDLSPGFFFNFMRETSWGRGCIEDVAVIWVSPFPKPQWYRHPLLILPYRFGLGFGLGSLGFWEWGCPKRGEAHNTVTEGLLQFPRVFWISFHDICTLYLGPWNKLILITFWPCPHKCVSFDNAYISLRLGLPSTLIRWAFSGYISFKKLSKTYQNENDNRRYHRRVCL